jgi:cysteinyl-tRNA synthetase, unknown class
MASGSGLGWGRRVSNSAVSAAMALVATVAVSAATFAQTVLPTVTPTDTTRVPALSVPPVPPVPPVAPVVPGAAAAPVSPAVPNVLPGAVSGAVSGAVTGAVAPTVPVPPLPPPRLGPLGAAKSWGYQLSGLDPKALAASPYDVLVIDYSRDGSEAQALTPAELAALKVKPDGGVRTILCYFSIGEAESYRYYWKWYWRSLWILPNPFAPNWREKLNGDWGGNYAVRYWDPAWQDIILGNGGYLDRVLKAGFDGVWMDKVDSSLEDVAAKNPKAKEQMIAFIGKIAARGRAARPGFLIVPQNGEELLDDAGYRAMIDGIGKESLLYGEDGKPTANPAALVAKKTGYLNQLAAERKTILSVEYLDKAEDIATARKAHEALGFVLHFATRELDSLRVGDVPAAGEVAGGKRRR